MRLAAILRKLLVVLLSIAAIAFFGTPFWVPALEHNNIFLPRRYLAGMPWTVPPQTDALTARTSDGVDLYGWQMHSTVQPARGTLLYFHGNGGDVSDYLPALERLRERGLDVLAWDYRGYGRSGGTVEDELSLYLDGEASLAETSRRTGLRPSQIVIYGYSLGTTVAVEMALRHGCRALVLQAPLATLRSHILAHTPWMPAFPFHYLRNRFETENKIGRIGCPLLVIHGEEDEGILVSQGRAVFAAAREPKRLVIVPGGQHVLDGRTGWPQIHATAKFLEELAP